jgi:hypothetical protein
MKSFLATIAAVSAAANQTSPFNLKDLTAWTDAAKNLGDNIGGSSKDGKVVKFCQATDSKTFSIFDLKQFGAAISQTLPDNKKLMWSVGE